jgi:uncharacterized membrane protein
MADCESIATKGKLYPYLCRPFWIGRLFAAGPFGPAALTAMVARFLVRCVNVFKTASDGEPIPIPENWLPRAGAAHGPA